MFSHFENLVLDRKIVVLSVDATGTDYKTARIRQIGLLSIVPGDVPRVFATDVEPHGFSYDAQEILDYLDDAVLVGYDFQKLALPLLIKELERRGKDFLLPTRFILDLQQICREKEPLSLSDAFSFFCGCELEKTGLPDQDLDAIAWVLDGQLQHYSDLPRTITELYEEFTTPDLLGLFRHGEGGLVFNFGPYCGRLLRDVGMDDPGYLRWMLESGEFLEDVQEIVKFPLGLAFSE